MWTTSSLKADADQWGRSGGPHRSTALVTGSDRPAGTASVPVSAREAGLTARSGSVENSPKDTES